MKTYESWHKPPIFIIFSFLRSIQTSESFFTFNTRNLQKLPDFTIFYSGIKKGLHGLAAWWSGVLPSIMTRVWRMPALSPPGARESCPSCQQNCQMLRNDHSHGHADLVGRTWHDFAPCQLFMLFSVPRSSKIFQGTKHWCPSTEHWHASFIVERQPGQPEGADMRWHLDLGDTQKNGWTMDVRHDRLCLPSWERSSSGLSRRSLNVADVAGTGWLLDVVGVSWETLAPIFQSNHVAEGLHDTASDWFNVDLRQLRWW